MNLVGKKIVFTSHALQRANERLNIGTHSLDLMFEVELKKIFKNSRFNSYTDDNKLVYVGYYKDKKIKFICIKKANEIVVNTVII